MSYFPAAFAYSIANAKGGENVLFKTIRFKPRTGIIAAAAAVVMLIGTVLIKGAPAKPAAAEGVALPVIMYHGLLEDKSRQNKYVISVDEFKSDLRYLKDNGYSTVVVQDLIDYVKKGSPLPDKPIMLTFDDGFYNNYVYAYPLIKEFDYKMVLCPVGSYTDTFTENGDKHVAYSYLNWTDIKEMSDSGRVEIQSHTYDLHAIDQSHKGSKKVSGETADQYRERLVEDLSKMQQETTQNIGRTPTAFAYPYGAISKEALPILKELGFACTMTCESRTNTITRDPECLFELGRYLRPHGVSSSRYFEKTVKLQSS